MKNIVKKLLGIDKLESLVSEAEVRLQQASEEAAKALAEAEKAKETERIAKLSPKELATEKKEPWVAVLDTHVNKENIRNGFFELDWNEYFCVTITYCWIHWRFG